MGAPRRLAAWLGIAMVLAACGGGSASPTTLASPTVAPTPTAGPSPAASPSPSISLAPMASAYLAISGVATVARTHCEADRKAADDDLLKGRAAAAACLQSYEPLITAMQAATWASAVQPDADAVLGAMTKLHDLLVQLASAPDKSALRADYAAITDAEAVLVAKADRLRTDVGLPPG